MNIYVGIIQILPGDIHIPASTMVSWSVYTMGRQTSLWGEDALEFNPDRWLTVDTSQDTSSASSTTNSTTPTQARLKRVSPYIWPVFNAGPRTCLGQQMATVEAVSVLAAVTGRFDLQVVEKERDAVTYGLSLTLPVRGGLWVVVKERKQN
jgi:cytochrome P450